MRRNVLLWTGAVTLALLLSVILVSELWLSRAVDAERDPGAEIGVYFPHTAGPISRPWMAAAFQSVLIRADGCLWMENDGTRRLPIWPPFSRPELVDGKIQIRSHNGTTIAIEGEWFYGGGGETDRPGDVPIDQVPEPCWSEIYWIVSPCSVDARSCGVGRRN